MVLADALTFTEKKFKPKFIVDLATLTGAIIVSLGSEYAGLFSNDDKLSKQIFNGEKVEEKVWRMPLHKNYDKLMNLKMMYKILIMLVVQGHNCCSIFTKICFKYTMGTSGYCWYGFFKIWWCFKLRWCNRIWS